MQTIEHNPNFILESIDLRLNSKLKFLQVKKEGGGFKIISYSENGCKDLERTLSKQRFIFLNLIKYLRAQNFQNTNEPKVLTRGHYPNCKSLNEVELDFSYGVIILKPNDRLCACAKIQIIYCEIIKKWRTKSLDSPELSIALIADVLEHHMFSYLSYECSRASSSESKENASSSSSPDSSPIVYKQEKVLTKRSRSDSSSKKAALIYCKDKIDKHLFGKSLDSETAKLETSKNQCIFTDIKMLDAQAETLCISYWKQRYIMNMSEANIYKTQEFATLKLNSSEASFNSLKFFFENPCMSSLLKHKIECFLVHSSQNINDKDPSISFKACNDASADINRMLPFLTLIGSDEELRVEHQEELCLKQKKPISLELICHDSTLKQSNDQQNIEEIKIKRPETALEKKIYFDKVIKFIFTFLNTITASKKFNTPKIKFNEFDSSDNDAFTSYCCKFIAALQKQKLGDKENDLRIDILIHLLLSLAQYNYTLPGQAIINLFPTLTLKNQSQRINFHFNEDMVNLSIQVSLIPNAYKFKTENLPYEIVIKHNLCANIFELPNWTSTFKVQMRNPMKNPPEFIALLEKIKFNTPL